MKDNNGLKKKMYEWTENYSNKVSYRFNHAKEAFDYVPGGLVVKFEKLRKHFSSLKIVTENEKDTEIIYPYFYL